MFRWGFLDDVARHRAAHVVHGPGEGCAVSRFLSLKWLRRVGEMSYSLYVWHLFAFVLVSIVTDGWGTSREAIATRSPPRSASATWRTATSIAPSWA